MPLVVPLASLDVDEAVDEAVEAVVPDAALVALADETVLPSVVAVGVTPLCCAAAWNSAPRNC